MKHSCDALRGLSGHAREQIVLRSACQGASLGVLRRGVSFAVNDSLGTVTHGFACFAFSQVNSMPRIGNARTIADIEFLIDAPSFGADRSAWISHGIECLRDRHRFDGQAYSYVFEVLHLRFAGGRRERWHVVIITELWRFAGSKSEVGPTKSLRVIEGRSVDVLSWMRKNRSAKLEMVTSPRHKA